MSKPKNNHRLVPKFSVVIPAYNRVHVLPRAIDSVLRQSCADFELLIIDDGSSDRTEQRISCYRDDRIRFVRHERNLGQNSALNTGIRMARGEFVSFLDSDDEWLPEMLEKVFAKFRSDPEIGCVYTAYGVMIPSGELTTPIGGVLEGRIYKEALEQAHISPPSALSVKRECFDVVGSFGLDVIICQDDMMCLKLAREFKFGRVNQVLATMHCDAGSRISEDPGQTADGYHRLYDAFAADILKYCGRGTIARHYAHSGLLFLNAGNGKMAFKAFCKSLIRGHSMSAVPYMAYSMLPDRWRRKVRGLRRELLHRRDRSLGYPAT